MYRDDTNNGVWDPVPVKTTIEFRGMQATYTFPVGVTTLWWYAVNEGNAKRDEVVMTPATEFNSTTDSAQAEDMEEKLFRFRRNM